MTKRELETEIAVWKGQTQFWKAAYLKAIKHDAYVLRTFTTYVHPIDQQIIKEAQHGTAE